MTGKETILYAEDEERLRYATRLFLEKHGYSVIEAANGEEAVTQFRVAAGHIDLLLFDVMMPLKNGAEALEEIQRERSDIKALFLSGYSSTAISADGITVGENTLLPKPIAPPELLRQIRLVLDGSSLDVSSQR